MKKLAVFLAALLLLLCPFPGESTEPKALLRIGVDSQLPPFGRLTADGGLAGFSPEVGKALCAAMERPCVFVPKPLHELLDAMRAGEIDLLLDITNRQDRTDYMDFSNAYYHARTIYVGRAQDGDDPDRLKNATVGARLGSAHLEYLQNQPQPSAIVADSHDGLLQKLCSGSLDVMLVNSQTGYSFLKSECGQDFEMLGEPLPLETFPTDVRIGVRKGETSLLHEVNRALADIQLSGAFARINRRYFPYSLY